MSEWYHVLPSSLSAFASTLNHFRLFGSHLSGVPGHLPKYVVSGPTAHQPVNARAGHRGCADVLRCTQGDIWNETSLPASTCAMPFTGPGLPVPHAISVLVTSATGPRTGANESAQNRAQRAPVATHCPRGG